MSESLAQARDRQQHAPADEAGNKGDAPQGRAPQGRAPTAAGPRPGHTGKHDGTPRPRTGAAPAASLTGALDLIAALRAGGAQVSVGIELDERAAPSARTSDCLGAVLREATTNALHHASGAPLRILWRAGAEASELEVTNPAGGSDVRPSGARAGTGLASMRERVEALGGTLTAGPLDDDGWRVLARVPTPAGDADRRVEIM